MFEGKTINASDVEDDPNRPIPPTWNDRKAIKKIRRTS